MIIDIIIIILMVLDLLLLALDIRKNQEVKIAIDAFFRKLKEMGWEEGDCRYDPETQTFEAWIDRKGEEENDGPGEE